MNRRMLIIGGLVAVLLIAIPLTVYIANQQQDVRSRADTTLVADAGTPTATTAVVPTSTTAPSATPTNTPSPSPTATTMVTPTTITPTVTPNGTVAPTTAGCATPDAVSTVDFAYPSLVGTQADFTKASCSWAAVNGAATYTVKVTQVESGSVVSSTSVSAPTITYTFPVEQGKTYRCDIAAVNACGTSGQVGSAQAVCATDGIVSSPTVPAPTTAPRVIPTVVATGDTNITMIAGIGGALIALAGGLLFFFAL